MDWLPDSSRKLARIHDFGRTTDIWVVFMITSKNFKGLCYIYHFLARNRKVKHANLPQNQSKGEQFATLTLHPSKPRMFKGMSPKKSTSLPGKVLPVGIPLVPLAHHHQTILILSLRSHSHPEIKSIPHQLMLLWKFSDQPTYILPFLNRETDDFLGFQGFSP